MTLTAQVPLVLLVLVGAIVFVAEAQGYNWQSDSRCTLPNPTRDGRLGRHTSGLPALAPRTKDAVVAVGHLQLLILTLITSLYEMGNVTIKFQHNI